MARITLEIRRKRGFVQDSRPEIAAFGKLILHSALCSSITGGLLEEIWA